MRRVCSFIALQVALAIAAVATFILIGELSLRVLHYFRDGTAFISSGAPAARRPLLRSDPDLGWSVDPSRTEIYPWRTQSGDGYTVRYEVDGAGFRSRGDPTSQDRRILFVGDSFTHAVEVSNEQTFYSLIRERLASQGTQVQVFAYGAGGYGTLQEAMIMERHASRIAPHVFVLQMHSNDIINNSYELELASTENNNRMRRPYLVGRQVEYLVPQSQGGMAIMTLGGYSRLAMWGIGRFDRWQALNAPNAEHEIRRVGSQHPGFQRSLAVTDQLLKRLRRALPSSAKLYAFCANDDPPFTVALADLVARHGFSYIDGVPKAVATAAQNGKAVMSIDGAHWAPAGHEVAASVLTIHLMRDLAN